MWQRWNQTTHIFEKSIDNGSSWTPLGLNASIITEGRLTSGRNPNPLLEDLVVQTAFHPSYVLTNTAAPADNRKWWLRINQTGEFIIHQINDANTIILRECMKINPSGATYFQGDVNVGIDAAKGNLFTTYPIY